MDFIQNAILEQEERDNPLFPIAHLSRADWDAIPIDQKWDGANKRQVRTPEGWVDVEVRGV